MPSPCLRLGPSLLLVASLTLATPVYAESMTVTASAYNATPAQTDGKPHIGAGNERIESGANTIALSPNLFKKGLDCGKQVTIESMGTFVVTQISEVSLRLSDSQPNR